MYILYIYVQPHKIFGLKQAYTCTWKWIQNRVRLKDSLSLSLSRSLALSRSFSLTTYIYIKSVSISFSLYVSLFRSRGLILHHILMYRSVSIMQFLLVKMGQSTNTFNQHKYIQQICAPHTKTNAEYVLEYSQIYSQDLGLGSRTRRQIGFFCEVHASQVSRQARFRTLAVSSWVGGHQEHRLSHVQKKQLVRVSSRDTLRGHALLTWGCACKTWGSSRGVTTTQHQNPLSTSSTIM